MAIRRVSPEEAQSLLQDGGYVYLDVRSMPEFEAGHPAGAYNVPLMHMGPAGMQPNEQFLSVVEAHFPRDAKLVLGCKSGGRSLRAAELLAQRGWTNVVDQRAGFGGSTNPFGQVSEQGWQAKGLPVSSGPDAERGYEALHAEAAGTKRGGNE